MEDSFFIYNYKRNMIVRSILFSIALFFSLSTLFSGLSLFNKNYTSPLIIDDSLSYSSSNLKDKYIKINLNDIRALNVSEYVRSSNLGIKVGEFDNSNYVALCFNNKILIADLSDSDFEEFVKQSPSSYTLRGVVKCLNEDKLSLIKNNLKELGFSDAQLNSLVFKNYVQAMSPLQSASQPIIISLIIFALSFTLFIHISIQNSKMLNSLNGFSNVYPDLIYEEIDAELLCESVYINDSIMITEHYLVILSDLLVAAIPLSELVWVYKKPDKMYKDRHLIKRHRIFFMLSNKVCCSINFYNSDDSFEELLSHISSQCPTTILGYSHDVDDSIKNDSKEFFDKWSHMQI
ncbi:MAG: DUF6709 family protein [Clostridium cadaveris]|uniref:DUF6709 family protein n=1 Tax=Clostridium cadaveris TaxID=1529 RepID=UPI002A84B7FD|nr:DUF6709 family protein [Clostridium cadaveris]